MPGIAYAPTLSSVRAFHEEGRLAEWCQRFLRAEGDNISFADGLEREDNLYLLAEVDLDRVWPCCGPDPAFDYPVSVEAYERKVEAMIESFASGWDAPPLFVHVPSWYLCDGTHRREALLRLRRRRYWAVLWQASPPEVGRGQEWGPRDGQEQDG